MDAVTVKSATSLKPWLTTALTHSVCGFSVSNGIFLLVLTLLPISMVQPQSTEYLCSLFQDEIHSNPPYHWSDVKEAYIGYG